MARDSRIERVVAQQKEIDRIVLRSTSIARDPDAAMVYIDTFIDFLEAAGYSIRKDDPPLTKEQREELETLREEIQAKRPTLPNGI